ncbi:MAG: hypothetical protein KC636_30450 [Myxococcales bacterium]|nr:hypothetical protein [Myxococcales bacterium]
MKKAFWWIVLLACAFVSFMGWQNAQEDPTVQQMAATAACAGKEGCTVPMKDALNMYKYGIVGKTYGFNTSQGSVVVECKREYMFFGDWSCAALGGAAAAPAPVS